MLVLNPLGCGHDPVAFGSKLFSAVAIFARTWKVERSARIGALLSGN